ncbi:conjugative transfer signal peptidase TraF [Rhizobium sp. RCC_161_2]
MGRCVTVLLGAVLIVVTGTAAAGVIGGCRLNLTASEPLGIWRIEQLDRPAAVGDQVFICLPVTAPFEEARERGYLRRGLCADGFAPLIKTVAAVPGDHVEIAGEVIIDGHPFPNSRIRTTDGEGRAIEPYSGGIVPPDHLFLHSSFASSYDSRYFGPIPISGLLGLAKPILTFDP